ncbi:MAG: hypothetical protein R2818_06985 [Flavobacteriales bacterium]
MEVIDDHKELVLLAAFVLWLLARGRSRQVWVRCIGLLLCLGFVIEMVAKVLGRYGINNHVLYNLFFVVDLAVIMWLLHRTFPLAPNLQRMITGALLIIVPALFVDMWTNGTVHLLATNALIIGGFLLGLVTTHALFILVREDTQALHRLPLFWVLLSIMVCTTSASFRYSACTTTWSRTTRRWPSM